SYDEAIGLPSQKAATLAVRTQQVIAYETDLTATVDPFAGSYAVESMTDEVEAAARQLIDQVEEAGGAVAAIESGFQKAEIEQSAYHVARQVESGERVVVGVNKFTSPGQEPGEAYQPLRVDPAIEEDQAERLGRLRSARDTGEWQRRITDLKKAAAGSQNVLVPLREALRAQATVGEACDALREVWGVYQPAEIT
ncbi:MAG: methylmalonyl-CoA mutase family protein, partial [Streptosporangiaceae bacterium]